MKKEDFFEVLGELDDDIVKGAKVPMKKKMNWWALGVAAACLCLIVVAFAAPKSQGEFGGRGTQPGGIPSTEAMHSGETPEATQPAKINLLVVNDVQSVMSGDMDVQITSFNSLSDDEWMAVSEDFQKHVGMAYEAFTNKIPDSFECYSFCAVSTPAYKDGNLNDEYRLHDYVFDYQSESGGEVKIAICPSEEPLRDYIVMCDEQEVSEINGVSVVIYGYQGTFMVEFSYENINYDIETSNIALEELENLLAGIME